MTWGNTVAVATYSLAWKDWEPIVIHRGLHIAVELSVPRETLEFP
jgi:hypothetical protein